MRADKNSRAAGLAMIIASVAIMLTMAHHPIKADGSPVAGIVHGIMIGLLLILTWAFLVFVISRGAERPAVLAGTIAYAFGIFADVGAATMNGFVTPSLVGAGLPPVSHDVLKLAWHEGQALAALGAYMTGIAYVLWSLDLLRDREMPGKAIGAAGLIAGGLPIALLAIGTLSMDVHGAMLIYALEVLWAALLGLLMWQGLLQPSGKAATSS